MGGRALAVLGEKRHAIHKTMRKVLDSCKHNPSTGGTFRAGRARTPIEPMENGHPLEPFPRCKLEKVCHSHREILLQIDRSGGSNKDHEGKGDEVLIKKYHLQVWDIQDHDL